MEDFEHRSANEADVDPPESSFLQHSLHRFIGALATEVLVGRDIEQQALRDAISPNIGTEFQLVAFVAPGGIGKTRLLIEAYKQLQPSGQWYSSSVLCLPLIDVADPLLHREVAFLREARDKIGDVLKAAPAVFSEFDSAFEEYQLARERGVPYQEVQQLIQKVVSTFATNYEALTQQYRVVWLVDTLEQLFGVQPEIEQLLDQVGITEADIGQTTYNWLLSVIEHQPANTTMVLAGRPTPTRWLDDLHRFGWDKSIFQDFFLQPFSENETQEYFTKLAQQLDAEGYEPIANYLKSMQADPDRPQVMYLLTGGNPIRLAMYIDMIANIPQEPDEFQQSLDALRVLNPAELESLRDHINSQLLAYIESGIGHPENAVLGYLFVTRRGLNVTRLKHIWGATEQQCQQVLDHLRRLSFIKWRNRKVFLHDELYTMYARRLVGFHDAQVAEYDIAMEGIVDTYTKIVAFLETRIVQVTKQINQLREQNKEVSSISERDRSQLRVLRQSRPRYIAEKLHYQLYLDPVRGFNDHYYVYAEQAFLGNDSDLDNYLQSEIEQFFFGSTQDLHRRQVQLDKVQWASLRIGVQEERAARWIKRLTQFNRLRRAQRFATELHSQAASVIANCALDATAQPTPSTLFNYEVEAYRCFAAIMQGEAIIPAMEDLQRVIAQIEDELRQKQVPATLRNRVLNMVAQCYLYNGYGYATLGSFRLAQKRYATANSILRHTQHEALQAEVQNDLSRALGELGERIKAEGYCQEGLTIRKELGFDYATALSLNTFALICNRNSRPTTARGFAKEALHLFRQLHNARGIILALIQRAEAKRRSFALHPSDERLVLLEQAEDLLKEAEEIFVREDLQEIVRLIGVKIERGSLYRDWAAYLQSPRGDTYFDQAIHYLDEARDLARNIQYLPFELDALVNKAYLFVYYKRLPQAEAIIDEAQSIVPGNYLLVQNGPLKLEADMNLTIFNQLSKLLALRARTITPTEGTFAELLTYHILGTTYSQIFSPVSWYSAEHQKELRTLLDVSKFMSSQDTIRIAHEIMDAYHLRTLEENSEIGSLQANQVIQELMTTRPEIDYL